MQFKATFKEEANLSFSFFLIEQFNVKYDLIRQCSLEKDGVLLINVKIGKI